MGNRGSKLKKVLFILNNTLLKEQRVDGSWQLLSGGDNPCLRFTLMGYESNSVPPSLPSLSFRERGRRGGHYL